MSLYMIVEHFKDKDAAAVYRRFRDQGRMAPEGLSLRVQLGGREPRAVLSGYGNRRPSITRTVDGELERPG